MKHIFIINPTAGKTDRSEELSARITAAFSGHDEQFEIVRTQYPHHATELAKQYGSTGEHLRLYACGGDGTLNEVLSGMYPYPNVELTQIPVGTGNDFIKAFGMNAAGNYMDLDALIHGKTAKVDLLEVDGKYSINIISAGFDASIAERVTKYKKLPFVNGKMAYNLSMVYCFFKNVYHRFGYRFNGKTMDEADFIFAVAANGKYYGGGFKAAPTSDLQDGLIDFIRVPAVPRRKMLGLVKIYTLGEHLEKTDFIKLERTKQLKIITHKSVPVNVDGEIYHIEDPEINILPSAIRWVVPNTLDCPDMKFEA